MLRLFPVACVLFVALPGTNTPEEALWAAARKGDAAAVNEMLEKGVNVNARTQYGATALSFACDKGHVEVVKLLLAHKADVNVKDTFYKSTPLDWALGHENKQIIRLLVEAGAKGDAALLHAAGKGDTDLVKFILNKAKLPQATLDRALATTTKQHAEVRALLTEAGARPSALPKASLDAEALKEYAGTYRAEEQQFYLQIVPNEEHLLGKVGGLKLYTLEPLARDRFQAMGRETVVTFQREGKKVIGMTVRDGKNDINYQRVETKGLPPAAVVEEPPAAVKAPANWPSFRGANASGVADGQYPPLTWDAANGTNIRWKTPIPGLGLSCPIVWGDRLFLTTAIGEKSGLKAGQYGNMDSIKEQSLLTWHVYCLDKNTGKVLWDRVAHEGKPRVKRHPKASHANPTCATDGRRVVACFGSEGLYCYDLDGHKLWQQELGALESGWFYDPDYQWGFGSSPVIYRDLVILQCDVGKNSFIAAYDLDSGKRAWMTPREEVPTWGTPTIVEGPKRVELVANGTKFVRGYDPLSGKELWRLGRNSEITVPAPIYAQGLIFVTSGYRNPRPIYAVRPGATGDITLPGGKKNSEHIAWSNNNGPYLPTPIAHDEHLYVCSNTGVVSCYEAKTGKRVWWERLNSDAGFTASPVAADGRLYFTDEAGQTFVLKAGTAFELLTVNALEEPCLATPAIADGMMFVRTEHHIFGIGRKTGGSR
jgi:outer membrane protein assembly factor BamB